MESQGQQNTSAISLRPLPSAVVITDDEGELATRERVHEKRDSMKRCRDEVAAEARQRKALPGVCDDSLFKEVAFYNQKMDELEGLLTSNYLPQHSPQQLISPRVFFVSPLFRVASRAAERSREIEITLADDGNGRTTTYSGPELRQEEGLVFMALINMVRDLKVGTTASFSPSELCVALFDRYDGPTRKRLKDYIRRLQRGVIVTHEFSVQLCLRFEYPQKGPWSVVLDKDIVRLFANTHIWLDLNTRRELPDGLATWLYAYIESQSSLIPTSIQTIQQLCGADASGCERAFANTLRRALEHLKEHGVIEPGFRVKGGKIHWKKCVA